MKKQVFHVPSIVTGGAVAVAILSLSGFNQPQEAMKWDFKMTTKHNDKVLESLSDDGWDYAGYLGESPLGGGEAVGLWRRPK